MEGIGTIIHELLAPELFPLVVVLYLIGNWIKTLEKVDNRYIPLILFVISLIVNILFILSTSTSLATMQEITGAIITILFQSVLFAAAPTWFDQMYKNLTSLNSK